MPRLKQPFYALIVAVLAMLSVSHVEYIYHVYWSEAERISIGIPFRYYSETSTACQQFHSFQLNHFILNLLVYAIIFIGVSVLFVGRKTGKRKTQTDE